MHIIHERALADYIARVTEHVDQVLERYLAAIEPPARRREERAGSPAPSQVRA